MQEFIVSTLEDENDGDHNTGDLSLREAIALSNEQEGEDTITFDSSLSGGTINFAETKPASGRAGPTLVNSPFLITDSVNIKGLGKDDLTIGGGFSGNGVFKIEGDSTDAKISGLTITDGFSGEASLSDGSKITIGGSISVEDKNSSLTLKDSLITESVGINGGGAIYNQGEVNLVGVVVQNSETDGRTPGSGETITNDNGELNISDSSIVNNSATAISNTGELNVSNSTIANNLGAGIFSSESGELNVSNSTIVDNFIPFVNNRLVGISNSGNASVTSSLIDTFDGSFTSGENNLIAQSNGENGFINGENGNIVGTIENPIDPKLGELQDNGGETLTQELLAGSPAIDAGSNPNNLATDQRGEGFNRTAGNGTDIGAFEVQDDGDNGGGDVSLIVTTLDDEDDGDLSQEDISLREAILNSSDGDTITFDSSLSSGTITLSLGELLVDKSLTIDGLGANNLAIDANQESRVFNIDDGQEETNLDVTIDGLTITDGAASRQSFPGDTNPDNFGGGISNQENLNLNNSHVTGNDAVAGGGGIFSAAGALTINNSTISDNSSNSSRFGANGGGISSGGATEINNSTISNNSAFESGGVSGEGVTEINNSTISGNKAVVFAGGINATGTITSSIVAGNTNENNNSDTNNNDLSGDLTSGGNNLIGDRGNVESFTDGVNGDIVGTTDNPIDPNLGELQNNGGATPTQELLAESPAIDAGSNPNNLATDQRGEGFNRTVGDGTDIGAFEVQTVANVNEIVGTSGGDVIEGTEESDRILGLDGNDTIRSLGGDDTVQGDNGNDSLEGGVGNDSLDGLEGFDSLFGGDGNDTLNGGIGNDSLDGGAGNDQLFGLDDRDTLLGGIGNDALEGNGGVDSLSGGEGDDNLFGLDDNDSLFGGTGNDLLDGGLGIDSLSGDAGDDRLFGLEDNDSLLGGSGNDLLDGGLGSDSLRGDDGNDTFVISSNAGTDTIADFSYGNDLIGLTFDISFADLSFSGNNIILGTETLATLNGVDTANLTESNFVEV